MSPQTENSTKQKKSEPTFAPSQEVEHSVLRAIIERASLSLLSQEDCEQLLAAVDTLAFLTQEIEQKGASIARLRKMLFGPTSEKTKVVFDSVEGEDEQTDENDSSDGSESSADSSCDENTGEKPKKKQEGHGRNGADAYLTAEQVEVLHESLSHKELCPCCSEGKVL